MSWAIGYFACTALVWAGLAIVAVLIERRRARRAARIIAQRALVARLYAGRQPPRPDVSRPYADVRRATDAMMRGELSS